MAVLSPAPCRDGTTDVTRVMHFGSPTPYQKECFTRVLKGHIKLCTMVFPDKIAGEYLINYVVGGIVFDEANGEGRSSVGSYWWGKPL